jgi:RNA polymerase sigma-70 factor, ECF subfamily
MRRFGMRPGPDDDHDETARRRHALTPRELEEAYGVLRAVARRLLSGRGGTLDPTALVHEAWLKVTESGHRSVSKAHFIALSVRVLRQLLVDAVRARNAAKRGGVRARVTLSGLDAPPGAPWEVIDLDRALEALAALEPRRARIAELRIFGGLEHEEIASALEVSLSTVAREWRQARAWLIAHLEPTP